MAIELKQTYTVLSSEKILNGGFSIDTTFWAFVNCTIASIAGGVIGNCLEITRVINIPQYAGQIILTTLGKTYRWGVWVKSGTSGDEAFELLLWDGVAARSLLTGISSPIWTYYELDFIPTQISGEFQLRKNSVTPGTMLFDECSVKEVITIYPNMKNKFSKLSKTKIWSLFNQYKNFQPSALWSARNAIISPSNSIWDYLIGWYWNAEGSGDIVYNMAPGNGVLGGGLLPNLDVINSGAYWSESGFAHSEWTDDILPPISYAKKSFLERPFSDIACLGMFVKRTEIWNDLGNEGFGLHLRDNLFSDNPIYIYFGNEFNNFILGLQWDTVDNMPDMLTPILNDWYFIFLDDTDFLKIACSDGTLYTSPNNLNWCIIIEIIQLILGARSSPKIDDYITGFGGSFGDVLLFNNIRLSQELWGTIYDVCASRYGMAVRTW